MVNDNLLEMTDERELLVVLTREMGHYVHADVWKFIVIQAALFLAGFWLAERLGRIAIPRFGSTWGFSSLSSIASLPRFSTWRLISLCWLPRLQ